MAKESWAKGCPIVAVPDPLLKYDEYESDCDYDPRTR